MKKVKQPVILNSKGQPIVLNSQEKYHADWMQRQVNDRFGNSLGYEVNITTLTSVVKKISEQKFFEILPADYLPIKVGEGQWSTNRTTFRSFNIADAFETGILGLGGNDDKLASADAGVDALNIKVFPWAKSISWSIFELEFAAKSGNWDLIAAKEESRKRNWDLGIQRLAFLGADGQAGCLGLLNQVGVTNNISRITAPISGLTTTNLKAFCAGIIEDYRSNCKRTAMPTHFIIPESDFNGLAAMSSPDFPIKSILEVLEGMFQVMTRKKDFKILPLVYGDPAYNSLGVHRYVLLNYDEKSVRMDIPLQYTNTLANSLNNFQFQNAGYGQFTGVLAYRPLEMMYFSY